jgi:hypothetical protein
VKARQRTESQVASLGFAGQVLDRISAGQRPKPREMLPSEHGSTRQRGADLALTAVKINAVALKGVNEDEFVTLVEWARLYWRGALTAHLEAATCFSAAFAAHSMLERVSVTEKFGLGVVQAQQLGAERRGLYHNHFALCDHQTCGYVGHRIIPLSCGCHSNFDLWPKARQQCWINC